MAHWYWDCMSYTHTDLTFCSHYLQFFTVQPSELMLFNQADFCAPHASNHMNSMQWAKKCAPLLTGWHKIEKLPECVSKKNQKNNKKRKSPFNLFKWPCSFPFLSETVGLKVDGHSNVATGQPLNDSDTHTLYSSSEALNKACNNNS